MNNNKGMSECSGPQTLSDPKNFDKIDEHCLKSTGASIGGTQILIYNPDQNGEGEICYRGRNRFMGYYKNDESTRKTIDA